MTDLPPTPRLPATVTTVLTAVAFVLGILEPSLTGPWRVVDGAVLAAFAVLGIRQTQAALTAHQARVVHAVTGDTGRGTPA